MTTSKYDKEFIKQALMGYSSYCHLYRGKKAYKILSDRRRLQNSHFDFNDFNMARIETVNKLLDVQFREAYSQAERSEQQIQYEIENKSTFITDYEIDFKLELYSPKKYAGNVDLEENPFFEFEPSIGFRKLENNSIEEIQNYKEWLFNENHNEFEHTEHPLKSQKHSWLLHDLYDHTYLSWLDIVDIEIVWIDVIVRIQNCSKIN